MNCRADVLIVTVTKVESRAVMQVFQEVTGKAPEPRTLDDRIYHDLGEINGARIFMALSEMGAGGLGASQQTVQKGIAALGPSAVIMAGIAFGINEEKQSLGDILVSQQLRLYDLQRVGKDEIILRGDKPHASPWLMNRLRSADLYWEEAAKVRFGPILTGEKLVDNVDYRDQLKQFEPEAIGGEMEGAGLYTACQDGKTDWILVKAICDWADGNKAQDKDERQKTAALNAARFVLHALQHSPLQRERDPVPLLERLPVAPIAGVPVKASRSTLPSQSLFFGREKELNIIAEAISPEARTWGVLIDGPGGIGKTALAIRAGQIAPAEHFSLKIFLSAKVRELTPVGEQPLQDFMLPNFIALISELARELGEDNIAQINPNERANAVRRALADKHALIVLDNVETFEEPERVRLYQFLSLLPASCKAIVTSRRRTDIDARTIRLDRMERQAALDLMAALAESNRSLQKSSEQERSDLYEITNGNPLLIKWVVGQLGRPDSQCRTIPEACAFLESAPPNNDPLEYIFGDLLDTFTSSETKALAALTHFTKPAQVSWIVDMTQLARPVAQTALEDLSDRALLISDEEAQTFFLPPLAATFLRRKRPEVVAETGNRLTDRVYALAQENGWQEYERFPTLEAEWPAIAAALPLFLQGDNSRLQTLCDALNNFLDYFGHWDEWLVLSLQAEERAVVANDSHNAGWRAYRAGFVYVLRDQAVNVLDCATRCMAHWQKANAAARQKAFAIRLRGLGYRLEKNYPTAIDSFQEALAIYRTIKSESGDIAMILRDIAEIERLSGDYAVAERDFREALQIAQKTNHREGVAITTSSIAALALDREDWSAAEAFAHEALPLAEALGWQVLIAGVCCKLAKALVQQGRPLEGLSYARRGVEINTQLRSPNFEYAQAVLKECEEALTSQSPFPETSA